MTKEAFVAQISDAHGITKKQANEIFVGIFDTIRQELAKGEKVSIPGFGTFAVKDRAERQGRNPKTGKAITIPASKAVGFKAAPALKDSL